MFEEEQEYDIFFQGSTDELLSLVYPLGPLAGGVFDLLELTKTTYQPLQKALEMRYRQTGAFENIEKPDKQVVYKSKKISNRTNYFYSTFVEEDQCFVWRNINAFLQMRPSEEEIPIVKPKEKKTEIDKEIEKMAMKRDGGRILERRLKSYEYVREMQSKQEKVELNFIGQKDGANYVLRNIQDAGTKPSQQPKVCLQHEYVRSLSR